jgi:hypothetical protein
MRTKGERVTVQFEMILPVHCSHAEILEWIRHELFVWRDLHHDNPLFDVHIEAVRDSVKVMQAIGEE